MLFFLPLLFAVFVAGTNEADSCVPTKEGETGFKANFYQYPWRSHEGWDDPTFFESGYKKFGWLGEVPRITTSNFNNDGKPMPNYPSGGKIYDFPITVSNYTVELTGFYKAPESGNYTLTLKADNGALVQFGAGEHCCNDAGGSVSGEFSLFVRGPRAGGSSTERNVERATYFLEKDRYYPVKIVQFNWYTNYGLNFSYYKPDGLWVSDMGPLIKQLEFNNKCLTTVTETWSNSDTSTRTDTGVSTDTIVVEVPTPTTTITTLWTGSTISSATVTATPGGTNTLIIQLPFSTTTEYGPTIGTTTYSDSTTSYVIVTNTYSTSTTTGPAEGTETVAESSTTYVRVTETVSSVELSTSTTTGPAEGTETVAESSTTYVRVTETVSSVELSTSTTTGPAEGTETVAESSTTYVRVTETMSSVELSTSTTTGPAEGTETVAESSTTYVRVTETMSSVELSTSTTTGPAEGTETVAESSAIPARVIETSTTEELSTSTTTGAAEGTETVIMSSTTYVRVTVTMPLIIPSSNWNFSNVIPTLDILTPLGETVETISSTKVIDIIETSVFSESVGKPDKSGDAVSPTKEKTNVTTSTTIPECPECKHKVTESTLMTENIPGKPGQTITTSKSTTTIDSENCLTCTGEGENTGRSNEKTISTTTTETVNEGEIEGVTKPTTEVVSSVGRPEKVETITTKVAKGGNIPDAVTETIKDMNQTVKTNDVQSVYTFGTTYYAPVIESQSSNLSSELSSNKGSMPTVTFAGLASKMIPLSFAAIILPALLMI